ncbi:MAG: class I SAM-dependent methyltransferase [Planctomycetes bacterium]|nr:class I SAM-dependent methyltransferase [Planctomycetota bacterium]
MISEALRYHSICKKIRELSPDGAGTILDVGSKGRGIGLLYKGPFVGVDLSFPGKVVSRMRPVSGSILNLPFPDRSFDLVVCSDVLEHLSPENRPAAALELARVARHALILGFPSGEAARTSDLFMDKLIQSRSKNRPQWLEEHLQNGPVDPAQIEDVIEKIDGATAGFDENQSLRLGFFLARIETQPIFKAMAAALCHLAPGWVGVFTSRFLDRPAPYARRIYTIRLR